MTVARPWSDLSDFAVNGVSRRHNRLKSGEPGMAPARRPVVPMVTDSDVLDNVSGGASASLRRCRRAPQQPLRAQVFVQLRPVDPVAGAGYLPVCALLGGGVKQARVPRERYGNRTAVRQVGAQRVFVSSHTDNPLTGFGF